MDKKIAFLGLGVMGTPMTINLKQTGWAVTAWNRTPERETVERVKQAGIPVAESIEEAVKDADYIFTCVGDVPDVKEVILGEEGVIQFAKTNALIVDFSTIGSPGAKEIASALAEKNLRFLDAPISGGDIGAENGTLTIMVGGKLEDFTEVKPYLEAMGKTIIHCGEVGSGQSVKMCNQALCAVYMVGLCEAIKMAKIQGIDPNLMIEVCSTGAGASWALSNLGPKIVESDYTPGFMVKHILKDLRLVQETIEESGTYLEGVELANRLFAEVGAMKGGLEQGTQGMFQVYDTTLSE